MSLFHERFRQLKEESGKTQSKIANDLGIKQQAVSYYANGREPDYDTLIAIASYFGVSADYLLGISNCKKLENENFCEKTNLSERALEILSGSGEPSAYIIYGSDIGKVIDSIICSSHLVNIISPFQLLTNPEWIRDKAKRTSLIQEEFYYKGEYDFVVAAAERQLSESIIAICTEIREKKGG
ncbi:helix-turn-helix transcriptional regulator [uncultured Agathobaculum sp.]|uniref:helix-turn-helix domain-containing protein n=1 Tax=uncultured Agathobaculum sp. TaxID=2048140 RepID=UPI00320A1FB7